jgi:hypothetical protein
VTFSVSLAVAADTTIISMSVSVPVLSEQMRATEPSVSTAGRRRTMALRAAIRWTPIASVMVMRAGKPSGIIDTAMPVTAWNISTNGMSRRRCPYAKVIAPTIRMMTVIA